MPDRAKIQIVPLGEWKGHSAGEQQYGVDEAQAMVERANRIVSESGNPLQIDYEHSSINPPASGAPAAGWMYSFTLEDDGIYADVEWTEKAREYIKNGEYKYISPVIATGLPDPVTGEIVPIELFNAALTNQPFMHDKIRQVMANKMTDGSHWFTNANKIDNSFIINGGMSMDIAQKFAELKAALGLAETAGPEEVIGLVKKMAELMAAMPGAPESGVTEEGMPAMEAGMQAAMNSHKLIIDLAADLEVEPEKIVPTVAAMKAKTEGLTATEKEVAELRAFKSEAEIRQLIDDNADRIPPAKREHFTAFAKKYGYDAAKEYVSQLDKVIPDPPKQGQEKETGPSEEYIAFTLKANRGMTRERAIELYKQLKEA